MTWEVCLIGLIYWFVWYEWVYIYISTIIRVLFAELVCTYLALGFRAFKINGEIG